MIRFLFAVLPRWILGSVMLAGIGINIANVVSRYLFGRSIFWAEEILVYLVIWGVFIGMAAAAYRGAHLNMDLFSSQFRGRWKLGLNAFVALVFIGCCLFAAVQSWQVVALFARAGQISIASGVPKAVPHAALLAGFVLTALAVAIRLRSYISGKF